MVKMNDDNIQAESLKIQAFPGLLKCIAVQIYFIGLNTNFKDIKENILSLSLLVGLELAKYL